MSDERLPLPGIQNYVEQFTLLFRDSPCGVLYLDESSRILACNAAARRIMGFTERQVLELDVRDPRWQVVREDGSPLPIEERPVYRCLKTRQPVRGVVAGFWNPLERRRRWVMLDAYLHAAEVPECAPSVILWMNDITSTVSAHYAERRARKLVNALLVSMSEGVAFFSLVQNEAGNATDLRFIDVNRAFEAYTGFTREQVVGKLATEVWNFPSYPDVHTYAEVARTGRSRKFETYFAPMDMHVVISTVSLGHLEVAAVFFDITAIKRAEAERECLVAELTRKNKELETIVYVASHDLRSPLVNVHGFAQRLERDCVRLSALAKSAAAGCEETSHSIDELALERIPRSIQFIQASATKMDRLIAGLLKLSRTGRALLVRERLDVTRIVSEIAASEAYRIEKEGAKLDLGALPACVGDGGQISQVFANLIDNAIKYRAADRPLRVKVAGLRTGREVVYTVDDTGIGIAADHLERIWEIFCRLDPHGDQAGEGLGLTLVRHIVERHGGRAWAESQLGIGSRFCVALPAADSDAP